MPFYPRSVISLNDYKVKNVNNSVISCPISIKIVFLDSHSSALPSHPCWCYLLVFVYLSVSLKVVKILVSTHLNHSCTLRYHQISWSHDVPETQIFVPNHCPPSNIAILKFQLSDLPINSGTYKQTTTPIPSSSPFFSDHFHLHNHVISFSIPPSSRVYLLQVLMFT